MRQALPILFLLLGGCASAPRPPVVEYALPLPAPITTAPAASTGALAPIEAPRPLTGRKLLYRQGRRLAAYAWHRWADSPPALLTHLLVERLAAGGRWKAVLPPHSNGRGDLRLEGTLLDFSLHLEPRPVAAVRARFVLLDRNRRVLAERSFEIQTPVAAPGPAAAAEALGRGASELGDQVARWLAGRSLRKSR